MKGMGSYFKSNLKYYWCFTAVAWLTNNGNTVGSPSLIQIPGLCPIKREGNALNILCSGFYQNPLMWVLAIFSTGTYAVIGTRCVESETCYEKYHKKKIQIPLFTIHLLTVIN